MKKNNFLILFIFFISFTNNFIIAQNFHASNFLSGSNNIRVIESLKFEDGFVLYGDFIGTLDRPETIIPDNRDIILAKFDPNFNKKWLIHIGGTLVDIADDFVKDLQGNFYILGSFQGTCSFGGVNELTSDGNYDVFIAKFTSSGTFVWAKKIAFNSESQRGTSIDFDGENLIIGGYYTGSINFDSQSFTSSYGMFFAKFDSGGNFIWAKNIPTTTSSSTLQSVSAFSDGYYFNGRFKGSATFDIGVYNSNNASYADVFLYKTNFNGTGQWLRRTYGDNNAFTGTITQDNYGNVYYTGYFSGSSMSVDSIASVKGKNAIINQGSTDMFILKYNKSGKMIWSKGFGETGSEWARDIKFKNNAFYLTGYFSGNITFGTDVLSSSSTSDQDAFIGVLDSKGNTLRATKLDDSDDNNESGMTVSVDDDNTIYWGGAFKSNTVVVGDSTFNNPNSGKQCVYMTKGKAPFSVAFSNTKNSTCNQSDDGELIITPYFGTPPYTYTWSHDGALNDSTATNLTPGSYTVTVTDALANTDEATYVLTEPDPIIFNPLITQVSQCSYSEEGEIDLNVIGGNGGYTYKWSASNGGYGNTYSTADQINLAVGTYKVTVSDLKNCVADTTILITGPAPVNFNGSVVTDYTGPVSNGAVNLAYSGGFGSLASFTFNWEGPSSFSQTTEDIVNLDPGNYIVTVTDVHACEFDTTFYVLNLDTFYIYFSDYKDACQGTVNGNATVSYFSPDGHTGITYQWDANAGNQATAKASNLAAGQWYSVTVTDIDNDPDIIMVDSVYINQLGYTFNGQFSLASTSTLHCNGDMDGFIDLNITSIGVRPYAYNWSNGAASQDITDLGVGTYGVTATDDNACRFTITNYSISQPPVLSAVAEVVTSPACNGEYNGEITVDRSGGTSPYTYQWDDPGYQNTRNADGLNDGYYTVTVSDVNNCTAISSVDLVEPALIQVVKSVNNETCNSEGEGSVSLTVTGGTAPFVYFWDTSNGSGLNVTGKNQSGLTAGKYYFTITDDNNCMYDDSIEITEPPLLVLTAATKTDVSNCFGENTGTITVTATGGTGLLTYTLNPGAIQTNNTGNFTGIRAGTYTVNVTDANSCGPLTTSPLVISEPSALSIQTTELRQVQCNGMLDGGVDITVTGGTIATDYTYNWTTTNGTGLTPGTGDQPGLGAGTYNLTVTDDNLCESSISYTLTQPTKIVVTKTSYNLTCNTSSDGSAVITVSGGILPYTYLWSTSDGSGLSATSKNQSGLTAGKYYFTVTDDNGCTYNDSIEITAPPLFSITNAVKTDIDCFAQSTGTINVAASGGTGSLTYTLNPAAIQTNSTGSFTGVRAGTYTVNVTDANGCGPLTTSPLVVSEPSALSIQTTELRNVQCNSRADGAIDITVTGGVTDYTYTWSTSNGKGLIPEAEDQPSLGAGTYNLTVTDNNLCESTRSFNLTQPGGIVLTKTVYDISCSNSRDGAVILSVSGGSLPFLFFWSSPNGSGLIPTNKNQGGLGPGIYYVVATDGSSCSAYDTVEFTVPQPITIDSKSSTDASGTNVADGTVTVVASGGTPSLTYTLRPDNKINQTGIFNSVLPGEYTVEVTDENFCGPQITDTITVGALNSIWETSISEKIKIYPNPTTGIVYFELDIDYVSELFFEIVNVSGEIVFRKEFNKTNGLVKEEIDLGSYSKGIYIMRVYNDKTNYIGKILLQ